MKSTSSPSSSSSGSSSLSYELPNISNNNDKSKSNINGKAIKNPSTIPSGEDRAIIYNDDYNRPEVIMIKEIVPSLDISVIVEILVGNDYDIDKSTDAALALFASLEEEEGTAVLVGKSGNAKGFDTSNNTSSHLAENIDDNQRYNKNNERNSNQVNRKDQSVLLSQRGRPVLLNNNFLSPPRYRKFIDRISDISTEYTVVFRRMKEKLGITIQEIDGEICIHTLHSNNKNEPFLAKEAGVKVGDILTGINSEFFSPGVEVQDVIDILGLSGKYVTLHFSRRHKPDDSDLSPYHKCAQILLDQHVITQERAQNVTKTLFRLKERVLQWDSGWITQRVESWKMEKAGLTPTQQPPSEQLLSPISPASSSIASAIGYLTPSMSTLSMASLTTNQMAHRKSDIVVPTRNLRPGLSLRLLKAEEKVDHVVYVVWVQDVRSSAEWIVKRRFREFHDFRDTLVNIRPSIGRLEFPQKRLAVGETTSIVNERLILLQKFLRKISSLVCLNSLHPSTARVQMALQQFLDVNIRVDTILLLEKRPGLAVNNMVQVYMHSVLQMSVMDKVLCGYIDNFHFEGEEDEKVEWTPEKGRVVLNSVKDFIDNLQSVLFDGICDDCIDIITKYKTICDETMSKSKPNQLYDENNDEMKLDEQGSMLSKETEAQNKDDKKMINDEDEEMRLLTLARCNEDDMRLLGRSAVRRQIEVEIYVPCSSRLRAILEKSFVRDEAVLTNKMKQLLLQPQSYFGIILKNISPSSWEKVVFMLKDIRSHTLPHDRLHALVAAAKEIPDLFIAEHQGTDKPLGADEFLPIFIYILVRAEIPELLALNEELQALCDPDKRLSETGYYLATLEASIQHLVEADINNDSDALFIRQSFCSSKDSDDLSFDGLQMNGVTAGVTALSPRPRGFSLGAKEKQFSDDESDNNSTDSDDDIFAAYRCKDDDKK